MNAYSKIPEQLLREYEPRAEWLSRDSEIHGVGHMARAFVL